MGSRAGAWTRWYPSREARLRPRSWTLRALLAKGCLDDSAIPAPNRRAPTSVRGTLWRSAPSVDRGERLAIHRGRVTARSHCGPGVGEQPSGERRSCLGVEKAGYYRCGEMRRRRRLCADRAACRFSSRGTSLSRPKPVRGIERDRTATSCIWCTALKSCLRGCVWRSSLRRQAGRRCSRNCLRLTAWRPSTSAASSMPSSARAPPPGRRYPTAVRHLRRSKRSSSRAAGTGSPTSRRSTAPS